MPPARRSDPTRRQRTRRQILDATRALLAEGTPLAAITVDEIAERASVGRATLYLHFPDKVGIVEALFDEQLAAYEEVAGVTLTPGIDRATLETAIRAWATPSLKQVAVNHAIAELAESDATMRAAQRRAVRLGSLEHTEWIGECRPDLTERQAAVLGELIGWMGERGLQRMCGVRDEPSCTPDELVDAICEVWWQVTHPSDS